jgi:hypothetical protein
VTQRQSAAKDFPTGAGCGRDMPIAFLREVDAPIRLAHPAPQRRGVALPDEQSGGKRATEFMENGSHDPQREEGRVLDA